MLRLGLIIAAMFALQAILSGIQMRHFSKEFIKLRRRGRVACGRKSGGFHAGAIVMFLIDGDGLIQEGKQLCGVTCFARVKPLPGFEGKDVGALTEADLPRYGKNLRKAVLDAPITNSCPARPSPSRRPPSRRLGGLSPEQLNLNLKSERWILNGFYR